MNEGATDGIAEDYFISGSSIGIVHTQGTKLNQEVTQGDYETSLISKLQAVTDKSPLDDDEVVQGRGLWMDDFEVVHKRFHGR